MNNKYALESLSMDLKRIALGYHRGSVNMANRFIEEALKRKEEIDTTKTKPYINTLLHRMELTFKNSSHEQIAEDCLMYSTLFQNYTQKFE